MLTMISNNLFTKAVIRQAWKLGQVDGLSASSLKRRNRYLASMERRLLNLWMTGDRARFWILSMHLIKSSVLLRIVYLNSSKKLGSVFQQLSDKQIILMVNRSLDWRTWKYRSSMAHMIPKSNGKMREIVAPALEIRLAVGVLSLILSMTMGSVISKNQHGFMRDRSIFSAWSEVLDKLTSIKSSF